MKKRAAYSYLMVLILMGGVLLSLLSGCTGFNNAKEKKYKDFYLRSSDSGSKSMVTMYCWSGDPDDDEIEIPDKDGDSKKITQLGGYYGTGVAAPFRILGTENKAPVKDPKSKDIRDMVFKLTFGKNISKIFCNLYDPDTDTSDPFYYVPITDEDGKEIDYRIFFEIDVDPENQYFYSEDGILYEKKNKKRVEGFAYLSDK